jgi:sterol 24-C-methyltransferase
MANLEPEDHSLEHIKRYTSHFTHDPMTGHFLLNRATLAGTTEDEKRAREQKAAKIAEDYYDFVSPLYENGWGQRFHYTPLTPGLSIADSMTKYEQEFARIVGLKRGMRVLDLGCGVGGPARTIANHIGCEIVGVANNKWHVERGRALTRAARLGSMVRHVHGDFMVSFTRKPNIGRQN